MVIKFEGLLSKCISLILTGYIARRIGHLHYYFRIVFVKVLISAEFNLTQALSTVNLLNLILSQISCYMVA